MFSFQKLRDLDTQLGPEMKSTGEVLGVSTSFREALLKGLTGAGFQMKKKGAVLISVRDSDKQEAIRIGERFESLGFDIYATSGTANVLNRHMVATNAIRNVDEAIPQHHRPDRVRQDRLCNRHLGQGPPSGAWLGAYPPHRGRARHPLPDLDRHRLRAAALPGGRCEDRKL